jgi:hypothetical protein
VHVMKTTATAYVVYGRPPHYSRFAAHRRRFFTKQAGYEWVVRQLVYKHCNCTHGDASDGFSFTPCRFHAREKAQQEAIMRRLELRLKSADRREAIALDSR